MNNVHVQYSVSVTHNALEGEDEELLLLDEELEPPTPFVAPRINVMNDTMLHSVQCTVYICIYDCVVSNTSTTCTEAISKRFHLNIIDQFVPGQTGRQVAVQCPDLNTYKLFCTNACGLVGVHSETWVY